MSASKRTVDLKFAIQTDYHTNAAAVHSWRRSLILVEEYLFIRELREMREKAPPFV
jgi:hypothetical protein